MIIGGFVFACVIGLIVVPAIQGFVTLKTFKLESRGELERLIDDIYGAE